MENKMQAAMWKSMKNCIRNWSQKWPCILFVAIYRENKQFNMLHQWTNSEDKIPGDPGESEPWATLCKRLPGDPSWKAMDWPEVWRGRHPYYCRETSRGNWPDDRRSNGLPKYHGQGYQNWSWYEVTYYLDKGKNILPLKLHILLCKYSGPETLCWGRVILSAFGAWILDLALVDSSPQVSWWILFLND